MRITLSISFILLAGAVACAFDATAAAGDADPSFGGAGYVRYAAPKTVPGLFSALLAQDDGSVIAAGGADSDVFVRHYRVDGSLDESFGTFGTTIVPGFVGGGRTTTNLRLFRGAGGAILIEQSGKIRRLSATGVFDAGYTPATLKVDGRTGVYNPLPQADGRLVVVTGQQAPTQTVQISVRFFLPDGTPDTARGGAFGERLLYPGGEGTYTDHPLSAVMDANGRILIAARWDRNPNDISLVLIRLNADGTYDATFGQNGVVLIGSQVGNVTNPRVSVGSDGRIAYLFGVMSDPQADPYFVVYVLTSTGQQDASAAAGGRISVVIPASAGLNFNTVRLLSVSREIVVMGMTTTSIAANPTDKLMLWHVDASSGSVNAPEFTTNGLAANDFSVGEAIVAGGRIWITVAEDRFLYGRVGVAPLFGFGRGVLARFDINAFTTIVPTRIVTTFAGRNVETFSAAKSLSGGGILVLGNYLPERQQFIAPTLTRFIADGRIDPTYGNGSGRVLFATGDGATNALVPSGTDAATVLRTVTTAFFGSCFYNASLWRFTAAGARDTSFGAADTTFGNSPNVVVAGNATCGQVIAPGFVDDQGGVNLVRLALPTITPLRYTSAGIADPAFQAVAQQVAFSSPVAQFGISTRLDALPDGRLQAIAVGGGNQQLTIQALRWQKNGAAAPTSPLPAFTIAAVDGFSTARDLDSVVLNDGRTLIAIDQGSQRIVLRLRSDGALDTTFGSGGSARIDGVVSPSASKLAVAADGKILIAYNTRIGVSGAALTIARLTPDGQRDATFTADGRFDSLFALNASETAAGVIVLPDGGMIAVGQSDGNPGTVSFGGPSNGHGLLLKLRGTFAQTALASTPVVEFFNTTLSHYFITGGPGEIVGVDKGGAGPGWERTGYGFRAFITETGIPSEALPVCRFYGTPGRGPNSHFYTVRASECAAVKLDPGWTYEGIAFYAYAPGNGQCAAGQQPVYRVYNNRFAQNDSNHRYMTDIFEYARMQTLGWLPEGVVLCGALQ